MPEKKTIERAHAAKRAGKLSSTQAGAFVKEQIDHIREGKQGAKSAKQAIAIGLSEARRAGVGVKAPKKGAASAATRKKAAKDTQAGQHKTQAKHASAESKAKRSATSTRVLKREGSKAASHTSLSKQAHASRCSAADRSASAKKGWQTRRKAASRASGARHAR